MAVATFLGKFFAHEAFKKVLSGVGESIATESVKAIKSNLFGIGENDEVLTGEAFTIAVINGIKVTNCDGTETIEKVSNNDAARIAKIFASYPKSVLNKATNIIGFDQQERITEINKTGANNKPTKTIKKTLENLRGAKMILMFSKMTDDEIKSILDGIGATTTFSTQLSGAAKKIKGALEELDNSEFGKRIQTSTNEKRARLLARKQGRR